MKKIICSLLLFSAATFLSAQSSDIPYAVKSNFQNKFSSTTAEWTVNTNYYVAQWNENGVVKKAYYSNQLEASKVVLSRTETDTELRNLSQPVQDMVNNNFLAQNTQYTLNRSFTVDNLEGVVQGCEFAMSSGSTLWVFFDAEGKMVKREIQ